MESDDLLSKTIVHLFLPKRTPDEASSNLGKIEKFILDSVSASVSQLVQESKCSELLDGIKNMLETWQRLQPTSTSSAEEARFVEAFVSLTSSQPIPTIPIYIRKQNCTLIMEQFGEHIQIETFRAALPSQMVMGSVGALSMEFPETLDIIQNVDLLSSQTFAKTLFQLATNDLAISTPLIEVGGREPQENSRDLAEPFLISEWLVSLLSPASPDISSGSIQGQIRYTCNKKVRDQVTLSSVQGSSRLLPFRRSGIWLSIKVTLQLQLLKQFQNDLESSKIIYKILMLRILIDVCKTYYDKRYSFKLDLDLAAQILAKIGRRVHKLEKVTNDTCHDFHANLVLLKNQTLEQVQTVLQNLYQFMRQSYELIEDGAISSTEDVLFLPSRSSEEYLADRIHSIPFLSPYKEPEETGIKTSNQAELNDTEEIRASLKIKRYPTLEAILSGASTLGDKYLLNERIWLYDTETYMKLQLHLNLEQDSEAITQLLQTYVTHSLKLYQGNPLGISQMLLVVLKVIQILDRIATKDHPLLLEYQSGINCATFDCLILPHKDDMTLMDEILQYFHRRNGLAPMPIGIITGNVSPTSFPVRFAAQTQAMIEVRDGILRETEHNIERLFSGLQKFRELQAEIDNTRNCDSNLTSNCPCRHCMLVKVQSRFKQQITLLERPLPNGELLQNAVIFEELIPQNISDLRNCLAILKFSLVDEPIFNVKEHQIQLKWLEYGNLIEYLPWQTRFLRKTGSVISLGSRRLNALATHHRKPPEPLTPSDSCFTVDNGLECIYSYGHSYSFPNKIQPITQLRSYWCAFQLQETCNADPYRSLQQYLEGYEHTHNEVIADQASCHPDLFCEEFIAFGGIRAGHRIQLRNLYREIASGVLSLGEEPVLALVLQTIWQMGPTSAAVDGSEGLGVREVHLDFEDVGFSLAFLDLLEKLGKENEDNYDHPTILITAVVIAVRTMELNNAMEERCYSLLKRWRSIIKDWTVKLDAKIEDNQDSADLLELRKALLQARICSALSYNFSTSAGFRKVMRDKEDMLEWFHTISILNQEEQPKEGLFGTGTSRHLSKFMRILLDLGRNVALRLHLERSHSSLVDESLELLVSQKWSKAKEFRKECLKPASGTHDNIVELEYKAMKPSSKTYRITFDFILGTFLVNGRMEGRLDSNITETPIFKRYFQHHAQLRVQEEFESVFRTVGAFQWKHYEFRKFRKRWNGKWVDDVIIKEEDEDIQVSGGAVLTLLEHENFRTTFNPSFVDNYTHWFDQKGGVLHFRRLPSDDGDYTMSDEYQLTKAVGVGDGWELFDEANSAYVLSMKSDGFKAISKAVRRLEHSQNVNVEVDKVTNVVIAHLPRYGLRFQVKHDGRLACLEYPDFHMAADGRVGTLIGLEQGIQLKSEFKRLLIIPNGDIITGGATGGCYHQTTKISLEEVESRQPPYFVYEFDQVLRRLVANKSKPAWLHLAALHAVTSSSLPDPFTGVTGTEMAVRILQSGFIWSSSPFDTDSLRILNYIKGLSPKRTFYGYPDGGGDMLGSMEVIEWPSGIPSMGAYDGFEIIVNKLMEDSERLKELHFHPTDELGSAYSSPKLLLRNYFRHLRSYNQGMAVEGNYFCEGLLLPSNQTDSQGTRITVSGTKSASCQLDAAATVACTRLGKVHRSPSWYSNGVDLFQYLCTSYEPDQERSHLASFGSTIFDNDFRTNWFALYKLAKRRGKSDEDKHRLTLILSAMAYRNKGAPIHQILNLHYISEFADQVQFPEVPLDTSLEAFRKSTYQSHDKVKTGFQQILNQYVDYYVNIFDVPEQDMAHLPESHRRSLAAATFLIQEFWPARTCIPNTSAVREGLVGFKQGNVITEVNSKLQEWEALAEPRKFADDVQKKLDGILGSMLIIRQSPPIRSTTSRAPPVVRVGKGNWKCGIQFEDFLDDAAALLNRELWDEAQRYFVCGRGCSCQSGGVEKEDLILDKRLLSNKGKRILEHLLNMVNGSVGGKVMGWAGLLPRMDPTSLLKMLSEEEDETNSIVKIAAGGLSVIWTMIKRLNRCLCYIASNQAVELERELGNEGHGNWSPREYPEWVLLELELDIMIRPVQVEVAKRMMNMPDGGNGIMQLNMGEGKTSVIVPMLCSTLSRKGEQLCRVTVLGSIFNMNYATLSFAIGGLLNRRIYTVPCKRDMDMDSHLVDKIQSVYEECMEMKGTVLTLPEYRLSFRLLAYDKILKQEVQLGLKLHQTENWLRENVRDVLDEADELLNVKYQLIYTIGGMTPVDGGDIRWLTCQKLLKIVQKVGKEFSENQDVEFDLARKSYQFAPIRLLDSKIHEAFAAAVADKFLEELSFTPEEKPKIKRFLTEKDIQEGEINEALSICGGVDSNELLNKILVASGYLRRGVLALGLGKRWRVEYGVDIDNTKSYHRQMAVPFRAKDVAAERTEFGHPDLAILLTHLSYYYSGLNDKQMDTVLKLIKMRKGAAAIYDSWIEQIVPTNTKVPGSLKKLSGINLKDAGQRKELYELLSKHRSVIDFWLTNKVFPKEAKEFPSKLVMTAWDLCYERQQHPITGFSGTNDTSELLPLPVAQQDLLELLDTNKKVEAILLQPENRGHRNLEMGVSCMKILEMMTEDNLTVLIDAGALLLECSNEKLGKMWLEVNPKLEATLYFNEVNNLMVKSRRSSSRGQSETSDVPFELSSFKGRLDKCGVFLDDQHSRGTDIRLPVGTKACVTVGGRMKRDKLIQACMRMRKLGSGHSVSFYLSHEASARIMNGGGIGTGDILRWVSNNTREFIEDGLLYWATAGRNYAQRLAAEENFIFKADPGILGEQCKDPEVTELMELYGKHIRAGKLVNMIPQWFDWAMAKLVRKNGLEELPPSVRAIFNRIGKGVVERCLDHIPDKLHYSGANLDEQQERELGPEKEPEIGEEKEAEREKVTPAKHNLHGNVKNVVINGMDVDIMEGIGRLCDIFKSTSFWDDVQPEGWGDEVYATTDFITVISNEGVAMDTDHFLRPIEYVVSGKGGKTLLLLSPFEVNELIPWFLRSGGGKVACHLHMFSPRRSAEQDVLLNERRLLLPKGSSGPPVVIAGDSRITAALLLASGNLYFKSMAEQRAFALFVSLAPKIWSAEEEEAFGQGCITKTMFMLPHYKRGDGVGERPFAFRRDPTSLIRSILACRHAVLSDMAHVIRLLNENQYVQLGLGENPEG